MKMPKERLQKLIRGRSCQDDIFRETTRAYSCSPGQVCLAASIDGGISWQRHAGFVWGIILRNIWPSLMNQWTAKPLGIKSSLSMAWNADLTQGAVTPDDDSSTTLLWDYEQQRLMGTLHSSVSNMASDLCLAWSPDGKRVLQMTSDGGQNNITCWDVQTQQTMYASRGTSVSDAKHLYYSPDGRLAAVIGDGSCVVLDANNGEERIVPSLDKETPTAVAWSPTGACVAFLLGNKSSGEMALSIWDTWTRQQVTRLIQTSVTYDSYDDLAALRTMDHPFKWIYQGL